jgi:hypothetical protein
MAYQVIAFFLVLGCLSALRAQPVSFTVPGLGYVFDKSGGSLRPIRGMAGAATIGEALALSSPLSGAVIVSRLDYAIARTEDHSTLVLIRNLSGEPVSSEIEGIPREADLVALSNSGRYAAIFSSREGWVRVISGLPDAPTIASTYDAAGARITALAISDDAVTVVAAFAIEAGEEPPAGVLRVHGRESGGWQELGPAARVQSIAFAPNGRDVAVVDTVRASVSLVRSATAGAGVVPVLQQVDGTPAPVAARFVSDTRLLVATATGVVSLNLSDNTRSDVACGCTPTGVDELDNGTFRLTELSDKPIWILYDSTEGMQLAFIPPPAGQETAGGPSRRRSR